MGRSDGAMLLWRASDNVGCDAHKEEKAKQRRKNAQGQQANFVSRKRRWRWENLLPKLRVANTFSPRLTFL